MKSWYVERELDKFRAGVRGMHFSDVEGMRMRPMALSLTSEDDVKAVAHYVETLPPVVHARTLPGDPQAGAALYATCSSPATETMAPEIRTSERRELPASTTGIWPPR